MALTQNNPTKDPRPMSLGPLKMEIIEYFVQNGDSTMTITANSLTTVKFAMVGGGVIPTAAITISGNQVTVPFLALSADANGEVMLLGE